MEKVTLSRVNAMTSLLFIPLETYLGKNLDPKNFNDTISYEAIRDWYSFDGSSHFTTVCPTKTSTF